MTTYKDNTYDINDRNIIAPVNITTFGVVGDSNSRVLIFRINRMNDGVDLSKKKIFVCYKNAAGFTSESRITDINFNSTLLSFNWPVPSEATIESGKVEFFVSIRDEDSFEDSHYKLNTKSIKQDVEKKFPVFSDAIPYDYARETLYMSEWDDRVQHTEISDSDLPYKVNGRTIEFDENKVIAVLNDNLSQVMSFRIKRMENGIDRSKMIFGFQFENANGDSDISSYVNVMFTGTEIILGWILDSKVTHYAGSVKFSILIHGRLENGDIYNWGTKPCEFIVENTLNVIGMIENPGNTWYDTWSLEADNVIRTSAKYTNEAKNYYNNSIACNTILEDLVETAKEQVAEARSQANKAKDQLALLTDIYAVRSDMDDDGKYREVKYYRESGILYLKSILNDTNGKYSTRTETFYDLDGTTTISSRNLPILYDINNNATGNLYGLNQLLYHGLM